MGGVNAPVGRHEEPIVRVIARAFAVDLLDRPGHPPASLDNSAAISLSRDATAC
jgi:hypothetical protein